MRQTTNQMNIVHGNNMVAIAMNILRLNVLVILIALTATAQFNVDDIISEEEINNLKSMGESVDVDELKEMGKQMQEDGEYVGKRFQGLSPEMIEAGVNPEDVDPLTKAEEQRKYRDHRLITGKYPPDMQGRMDNINAMSSDMQQQFQGIMDMVNGIMAKLDAMMESIDAIMTKISLMIANLSVELKDVGDPPNKNKSLYQLKADMEKLSGMDSEFISSPKETFSGAVLMQSTTRISSMQAGSFSGKPSATSVTFGD